MGVRFTTSDSVTDLIVRIRNSVLRGKSSVLVRKTKFGLAILAILKQQGYIESFSVDGEAVNVVLKYKKDKPVIEEIVRISKPSKRSYVSSKDIQPFYNGLGVVIVSTSKGLMVDHDARQNNLGGELICKIY